MLIAARSAPVGASSEMTCGDGVTGMIGKVRDGERSRVIWSIDAAARHAKSTRSPEHRRIGAAAALALPRSDRHGTGSQRARENRIAIRAGSMTEQRPTRRRGTMTTDRRADMKGLVIASSAGARGGAAPGRTGAGRRVASRARWSAACRPLSGAPRLARRGGRLRDRPARAAKRDRLATQTHAPAMARYAGYGAGSAAPAGSRALRTRNFRSAPIPGCARPGISPF